MPNILIDLEVDRVDLVNEGANSEAFIKLYKRKESCDNMDFNAIVAKMKPEHAQVIQDELAKAKMKEECTKAADCNCTECAVTKLTTANEQLAKATADLEVTNAALAKANEKLEEVAKSKESISEEEVIKGLDPAVQAIFKTIQDKKDAAEQVVKQLNEQKVEEQAIAKAKELKAIPVDEAKLLTVVKSASDEVYEVLKAASKAIETGVLLTEVGKSKTNNVDGDAWATIEKKADELVASEGITKQKAIATVIKTEPKLYGEYLKGGLE